MDNPNTHKRHVWSLLETGTETVLVVSAENRGV